MARAQNGKAISAGESERARIAQAAPIAGDEAKRAGDLRTWRRATAVLGLAQRRQCDPIGGATGCHAWFGQPLVAVVRSGGNGGSAGTRTAGRRGAPVGSASTKPWSPMVEAGPMAAGYQSGIWTGPMIGELIRRRFGVTYHNHHIPRLLHKLGFSVATTTQAGAQDIPVAG